MSFPIIPPSTPSGPQPLSTPSTTSGSNPAASAAPVDFFAPSLAQSLSAPPLDASSPRLSIANFYGAISSANLAQKLREYLDDMNDPLFRKALMKFAAEQASYMAEVITLVYKYDSLRMQLANLDLQSKADRINDELGSYGGASGDNNQIHIINAAGTAYNSAQSTYQNALVSYQSALNIFETAQTTYNNALGLWNSALAAYQSGLMTQPQLEAARATFQAASNQFDTAKTAFASAQTTFDTAKTNWANAVSTYSAAVNSYSSYAASRNASLSNVNSAINDWNTAYGSASNVIAQMNDIRNQLGLAPVSSTGSISPITGLPTVTMPTGPSSIRNAVQNDVNQDNALIGSINSTTGTIGGRVTVINGGGYNPPLTTPATLIPISGLPTTDSNNSAQTGLADTNVPTSIIITTPADEDLIQTYLLPRISILFEIQNKTTKEELFREDTDSPPVNQVSGRSTISSGAGGSGLSVANGTGIAASPFLSAILSKHAFESMLNVYGVPAGSPLVDQIGALYTQISTNAGLASAGPASQILSNAVLTGANGRTAIDAAVALGNLGVVSDVAGSSELRAAISALIENDPTLANLTPEQRTALLDSIVGEVGASLIRSALNEVARALGLPGLTPQILAILAGLTAHDPLASFSQQLYRNVLFAEQIAKEFQLSDAQANLLIEVAIKQQASTPQASAKENAPPQQAGDPIAEEQALIEKSVTEQLVKTGLVRVEVEQKIQRASAAASDGVKQELLKADIAKTAAFKDSLRKSFEVLELDPAKADLLAAQIPIGPLNEITALLIDKGLTLPEANQVATDALSAAERNDPARNPLSSFLVQQLGTSTEMAGLLKGQIVSILSPAVGARTALEVAEDYGNLVFSSANGVTNVLLANERRLDAISYFVYDVRLNENYREATISYRSPELDPDSPLKLGKTLLLAGIPGGLANQGLTSQDNTLGPSAGQSKHATTYPGIFG